MGKDKHKKNKNKSKCCAEVIVIPPPQPLHNGIIFRGYLGLSYIDEDGNIIDITDFEFDSQFVPLVANAYPDGFTIYSSAQGGYKYQGVTEVENVNILEIVVPNVDLAAQTQKFYDLVHQYTIIFFQKSEFWTRDFIDYFTGPPGFGLAAPPPPFPAEGSPRTN
jgi:hypothetical protein